MNDLVPGGAVLQGKLTDDPTELVDRHVLGLVDWQTHKQQESIVSGHGKTQSAFRAPPEPFSLRIKHGLIPCLSLCTEYIHTHTDRLARLF